MEITVEQLHELILEEEQMKKIAQTQSDRLDYEASVELMERVMNAFPIQPEEGGKGIPAGSHYLRREGRLYLRVYVRCRYP